MAVVIENGFTDTHLPHIGWERITGTISASTEASGYEASRAGTVETFDGWQPTSLPATWEIDVGSSVDVTYCGIAAHDLGTNGCTVVVGYWDGSAWQGVVNETPSDDTAIFFLITSQAATKWRVRITGTGSMPTLGHIAFGEVLVVPRRATYLGTPLDETEVVTYRQNLSETGELLGRNVEGNGLEFQVSIDNLSEDFRLGDWRLFKQHCDSGDQTFFIAPKPASYPGEVAYAWCTESPRVSREIANERVTGSVTLQCRGYRKP